MKNRKKLIILGVLAVVVTATILVKQPFLRTLPLMVSVFVMLLQSDANRYGYLAGGLNSILYAWVYYKLGLVVTAASALLVYFPLQVVTFWNWNRRAYQKSTQFKKLSGKARVLMGAAFLLVWAGVLSVTKLVSPDFAFLDTTSSVLGWMVSFLTLLAYVEYSYLWLLAAPISLFLNLQVMLSDIRHLPYVIYSLYSVWCAICAAMRVHKLYQAQQEDGCVRES